MTQKIKVITVATESTPELAALERSCRRHGMDLTVLGLGKPWLGFGMKILLTYEYLKALDGYTHFIFVDAYDTLFIRPVAEVPEFIVFSTEKNCWPDVTAPYPPSPATWKYLNSGCYSAPISEYLKLIEANHVNNYDDDQRYFTKLYLAGNGRLDTNCIMFQSMAFAAAHEISYNDGLFRNNITFSTPSILHFNGKCHDKTIYAMVEYNTLQECKDRWQDSEIFAKEINETFVTKVNAMPELNAHRTFVEQNVFGFGERSFPWLWNLLIKEMPKEFTFLEVGVFKGQTLSLVELLAKMHKRKATRYGVTPLSSEGGVWESDYKHDIEFIHDQFKLNKDYELLVGLSEDPAIIEQASKLQLDILYIDGAMKSGI